MHRNDAKTLNQTSAFVLVHPQSGRADGSSSRGTLCPNASAVGRTGGQRVGRPQDQHPSGLLTVTLFARK